MKTTFRFVAFIAAIFFRFFRGHTVLAGIREVGLQLALVGTLLRGGRILNVVVIKPSTYDDDSGWVMRDWRGAIPSNTLATLYSLIEDMRRRFRLGTKVRLVVRTYDEAVQPVHPDRIATLCTLLPAKSVVLLAGVQTCQFARASDLAVAFVRRGLKAIVGGFHVTGVWQQFPPDSGALATQAHRDFGLTALLEAGVSLFVGEAEGKTRDGSAGRLQLVLADALAGQLRPVYDYLDVPPSLDDEPAPVVIPRLNRHFLLPNLGTIDTSRGCPFRCDYCTVWTTQGNAVRNRGIQRTIDVIRTNWVRHGVTNYFFTSDNLSRSRWRELFTALIELREREGIRISFSMQVDTRCDNAGFIELAAQAGCNRAFIGLESVDPVNLEAVNKRHNRVGKYQALFDAFHAQGIMVHLGYMLGLPNDTVESIEAAVERLIELGPDEVSFFCASPLPGANDHRRLFEAGVAMDSDMNSYTTFRPVCDHPKMSRDEWKAAYDRAWARFYSVENCVRILRRTSRRRYWESFWHLIWNKYAIQVSGRHPMISGFIRVRDRHARRSTFPQLNWLQFQLNELRLFVRSCRRTFTLLQELAEIWLQTRRRSERVQRIVDRLSERVRSNEWLALRHRDLRDVYRSLGERVPGRLRLDLQLVTQLRPTRADLSAYWEGVTAQLRRGKFWVLLKLQYFRALRSECTILLAFLHALYRSRRTPRGT